jgi:hypothetical protein
MKTKFIQDFRGRETNEQFYEKGQIVEGDLFAFLAPRGIVEIIEEPEPPAEVVPGLIQPIEVKPQEKKTPHKRQGKK